MAIVQTEQQSQDFWNKYSADYIKKSTAHSTQSLRHIISMLKLESCTSLVEAGCGGGESFTIIREKLPPSTKILANDYSHEMVSRALAKNIENVEVILASNLSLPYSNEICDRYIANLSLHIVPDARDMLREAFRVLKPGGLAGFSVWGMKTVSDLQVIQGKAMAKTGIEPKTRSHFYLNDQQELNGMLREEGFIEVRSYYSALGMNINSEDEAVEYLGKPPSMVEMKENTPELYNKLMENIRDEVKIVLEEGYAITFNILLVFGKKPIG